MDNYITFAFDSELVNIYRNPLIYPINKINGLWVVY